MPVQEFEYETLEIIQALKSTGECSWLFTIASIFSSKMVGALLFLVLIVGLYFQLNSHPINKVNNATQATKKQTIVDCIKIITGALIILGITDFITSGVLKPYFGRLRPSGRGLAFPSAHAANISAQAIYFYTVLTTKLRLPRLGVFVILLNIVLGVGVSRVILMKHWPIDVLGGYLTGGLISILSIYTIQCVFKLSENKRC